MHHIRTDEAEQLFFNRYVITPNKKHHGPKRFMKKRILRKVYKYDPKEWNELKSPRIPH